jgi:ubiquinol-cytochrome c reductase cytochrome b subunit
VAIIIFAIAFCAVIFFAPEMGGYFLEHANFEPANMLKTPEHIAPVWYFTPFYAILRAVPSKGWGAFLMAMAIVLPVPAAVAGSLQGQVDPLPRLDLQGGAGGFRGQFLALGFLGLQPASTLYVYAARFFGILYFAFFLLMPLYTAREKTKPVPERVVYHGHQ